MDLYIYVCVVQFSRLDLFCGQLLYLSVFSLSILYYFLTFMEQIMYDWKYKYEK